jgi:ankyrin repeat protein
MNIIKVSFYQKIFFLTSLCITTYAPAMMVPHYSQPFTSVREYYNNKALKERDLRNAAKNNDAFYLAQLINKGVDVNAKNVNTGNTALHSAAENGHVAIAEILLASGAHVNIQNHSGNTPLHKAIYEENIDCVHLLLVCGADQTIKNNIDFGYCPSSYLGIGGSPAEGNVIKEDNVFFNKVHPILLHDRLEKVLQNKK